MEGCFLPRLRPDKRLYLHSRTQTNTCFVRDFVAGERKSKPELPGAVFSGLQRGLGGRTLFLWGEFEVQGILTSREWHPWNFKGLCEVPPDPTAGGHPDWEPDVLLGLQDTQDPLPHAAVGERAEQCPCPETGSRLSFWDGTGCRTSRDLGVGAVHRVPAPGPTIHLCLFLSLWILQRMKNFRGVGRGEGLEFRRSTRVPPGCQQAPCGLGMCVKGKE